VNFENQIKRIASKSELFALIENLPEDGSAFLLTFKPEGDLIQSYMFPANMSPLAAIGLNDVVHRYSGDKSGMTRA
jgi:hypothetical protein